jgi:ATP-dependent phosphofructokinase / diphosphate-dependent phosphofructokinase
MKKRIGIMTGGGDAPGLNGIIEASARCLLEAGWTVVGIQDGFEGIFENRSIELTPKMIEGIHSQAGTLLGTSNKSRTKGREAEFLKNFNQLGLEGLIAVGGDGTFDALKRVSSEIKIIGVPKTIDNDLAGTDVTFGFDTACAVIGDAVGALRATADAHRRVIFIETMGRTAGWIALGGGLAGYADAILIPEMPFDREKLAKFIRAKKISGKRGLIVVVAEGAFAKGESAKILFRVPESPQAERYGGIAESLARWTESETGWESRHVVPGHLQRARHPTTTDRFLTLAMGVEVARMVTDGAWNQAVVYRAGIVARAPLADLMQPARLVSDQHRWVGLARSLGIYI